MAKAHGGGGGHSKAHGGGHSAGGHGGGHGGGDHGGGHSAGGHSSGGGHGGGGGVGAPIGFFGFILFLLAFYFLLYKPQHKNVYVQVAKEYKEVYDYSDTITFVKEYNEIVNIGEDRRFAFSRSSVPYCAKNEWGIEKCGGAGESVAKYFSHTSANRTFYFKTSNGDSLGTICIDFFKLVEK